MRGTLCVQCHSGLCLGIIPAYAGNTCAVASLRCATWDHPRVCGEHNGLRFRRMSRTGSSPRMRGTLCCVMHLLKQLGIIPAYAGNTAQCRTFKRFHGDHPRVCGEHGTGILKHAAVQGSSPRMRGTLDVKCCGQCFHGIIPAYAGNTLQTA